MANNSNKTLVTNYIINDLSLVDTHESLKELDNQFKKLRKEQNTFAGVCSVMWGLRTSKVCNYLPLYASLLGFTAEQISTKKGWMAAMKSALADIDETMKGQMEEDGTFKDTYVMWGKKAVTFALAGDEQTRTVELEDGTFVQYTTQAFKLGKDKKKVYVPNATQFSGEEWSIDTMWKFFLQSQSMKKHGVVALAIVESEKAA